MERPIQDPFNGTQADKSELHRRSPEAQDAGAPANPGERGKHLHSFEYYRDHGAFGRDGERLSPNDPRGHMSHGHGGGHP